MEVRVRAERARNRTARYPGIGVDLRSAVYAKTGKILSRPLSSAHRHFHLAIRSMLLSGIAVGRASRRPPACPS